MILLNYNLKTRGNEKDIGRENTLQEENSNSISVYLILYSKEQIMLNAPK